MPLYWEIDGQKIPYSIRESKRAKHARIEIQPNGDLLIVRPRSLSLHAVQEILWQKRDWVLMHRKRILQLAERRAEERKNRPPALLYLGKDLLLQVFLAEGKRLQVQQQEGILQAVLPAHIPPQAYPSLLEQGIEEWYRGEAKRLIPVWVQQWAQQFGLSYGRVFIKGQKTRWGSCSSQRNLNFNWRLIMCPRRVIDYIIIHELCHLTEMNHSPRFWQLVAERCPDFQESKRWLQENGRDVMQWSIIFHEIVVKNEIK